MSCPRQGLRPLLRAELRLWRTTKNRFQELQEHGALKREWVRLPAVIHDAIALVDAIGESYLWTGSMCIIFDDPADLEAQIFHMSAIHGSADLTIGVISSSNANEPLPELQPHSRLPLPQLQLWGKGIFVCPVPIHLQIQGSIYITDSESISSAGKVSISG